MKSLFSILLATVAVCIPMVGRACDVCGCGLNTGSLGFLPLQQRHFFGLRWQLQHFDTQAHEGAIGSNDVFRSLELWGRWQLSARWQLIGMLPYQLVESRSFDGDHRIANGLGDASLLIQYTLLDPRRQTGHAWQHALQFAAGAKLPTGQYRHTAADGPALHANLQSGTGTTDVLLAATYIIRHNALGVYLDGTARLTTANTDHYRFGNRINSGLRMFWWKPVGIVTLVPHAGIVLDAADLDADHGKYQGETGGYALYGSVGTEIYIRSLALGISWQTPLVHQLADGLVTPQPRLAASATWMFGGRKEKKVIVPAFPDFPVPPVKQ